MVPQVRIGLTTPSLPRMCATTTLLRQLSFWQASTQQHLKTPTNRQAIIHFFMGAVNIKLFSDVFYSDTISAPQSDF